MLKQEELDRLKKQATAPAPHRFPKDIIGAPCSRCGARGLEATKGCHPPKALSVDRVTLLELLEMAQRCLDPEKCDDPPVARMWAVHDIVHDGDFLVCRRCGMDWVVTENGHHLETAGPCYGPKPFTKDPSPGKE
jgi:hypothetical protein